MDLKQKLKTNGFLWKNNKKEEGIKPSFFNFLNNKYPQKI